LKQEIHNRLVISKSLKMSLWRNSQAFLLICYKIIDKNVVNMKLISTFAAAFERKELNLTT